MRKPFIIDAHVHLDPLGKLYTDRVKFTDLLWLMEHLSIAYAVCTDHLSLYESSSQGMDYLKSIYEESQGRILYLGVFDPRKSSACLQVLEKAAGWQGFSGIKIHPSFHNTPAEDPAYSPIWQFANDCKLPIMSHSWSISSHNPAQALSTPERFERYIEKYPEVNVILAHAGGRGNGRNEIIRLIHRYDNVYTDIAGDTYCYRLIESLADAVPPERILFGSDFPWLDPRSNLSRVLLADIAEDEKEKILVMNARQIYKIQP